MYNHAEHLPEGACDICGSTFGHLEGCIDDVRSVTGTFKVTYASAEVQNLFRFPRRGHSGKMFSRLWPEGKGFDWELWVSVGAGILLNVVVWFDVLIFFF